MIFSWNELTKVTLWQRQQWTDLTSEVDVLFIAYSSCPWVHNLSLSISRRWWRTCLKWWASRMPKPLWLIEWKFNDLISWREWSRKRRRVPFSAMPYGRQEGKQKEREGGEGREEWGWKREHKRLLLVVCMALKSPEGPWCSSFFLFKKFRESLWYLTTYKKTPVNGP